MRRHVGRALVVLALCWLLGRSAGAQPKPQGPAQPPQARLPRPNIVLILADDMGYSDLGCYGSEIRTPNLDQLARGGLRFSQFYNAARCCPTRASLMTGLWPHQAGVGHMMEDHARPGYRGNLNQACVTIAELLGAAGYQTMMCGKWHLTRFIEPGSSRLNWPLQRGFERFFGTLAGGGSYFDPVTLTRGNEQFRATGDFYYTDALSDQAARFVEEAARSPGKPFFLYVAYTAPHWPLHARPEIIDRYKGKYHGGWDDLRQDRVQRMTAMGLVKREWRLTPRDPRVPMWEQAPRREWQQRRMEVYAAQVDALDQGIGRILERVRQVGVEQNTLVMFLSDNGGCAEELPSTFSGVHVPLHTREGRAVRVGNSPDVMPGPADTYQSYGVGWANASNTPFRLYKHWVHEGGIATPLIVSWPALIREPGITHQVGHVMDIMATCADVARTQYPTQFAGHDVTPTEGESLLPIFLGKTRQRGPIYWEHEGNRAVREGRWKLVGQFPGNWELYDMEADRTELSNLAQRFPVLVKDLSMSYESWAKRAHVEPWTPGTK